MSTNDEKKFIKCVNYDGEKYKIPYIILEKLGKCMDWHFISNTVTEDTCTPEFYKKFSKYLNWQNGKFLKYVDENDIDINDKNLGISTLLRLKGENLSEDFCNMLLESKNYYLNDILTYRLKLSNEFIERVLKDQTKMNSNIVGWIIKYQKVTKEQYEKYNYLFDENDKFKILCNANNDFSIEFLTEEFSKLDINGQYFRRETTLRYLAHVNISNNALSLLHDKINLTNLLKFVCITSDIIEKLVPYNKKKIFNILMKEDTSNMNSENLEKLNKILASS